MLCKTIVFLNLGFFTLVFNLFEYFFLLFFIKFEHNLLVQKF